MAMGTATGRKITIGEDYVGEIVEERYNPLIKRKEVTIVISHPNAGTPMRFVVREAIAKHYNVEIDKVYVRKIESEYGMAQTRVYAHIYDSVERALSFEPKHIIIRNKGFEEE